MTHCTDGDLSLIRHSVARLVHRPIWLERLGEPVPTQRWLAMESAESRCDRVPRGQIVVTQACPGRARTIASSGDSNRASPLLRSSVDAACRSPHLDRDIAEQLDPLLFDQLLVLLAISSSAGRPPPADQDEDGREEQDLTGHTDPPPGLPL